MSTMIVGREESLRELQTTIGSADIRNDAAFQAIFREAKVLLELSDEEISEVLLVSRPTVNRWANGRSPHPGMRKRIFGWIEEELKQKLKKLSSARSFGGRAMGAFAGSKLIAKH